MPRETVCAGTKLDDLSSARVKSGWPSYDGRLHAIGVVDRASTQGNGVGPCFRRSSEAAQLLATFDQDAQNGVVKVTPLSARIATEFERVVERCLSQTPPIFIRTLDALHIATAREANEREMVSTDKRLRNAAMLFGLTLFPPASITP